MDKPSRWRKALLVAGLGLLALAMIGAVGWVITRPGGPWDYFVISSRLLRPGFGSKGRATMLESDSRNILAVARAFHVEQGRWPESIAELTRPTGPNGKALLAQFERLPRDPWGNEYLFEIVDDLPRVTSLGSDGRQGGDGEAADRTFRLEGGTVRE